jgi:hypothetical protein
MIRKCTDNVSDALGDFQRGRATGLGVRYELTVGREYRVLGMLQWETTLFFIVNGDHAAPVAVPAGLFEASSSPLPGDWWFALGPGVRMSGTALWENPLVAIWGYRELVDEAGHLDSLLEGEPSACAVFYLRLQGETDAEEAPNRLF